MAAGHKCHDHFEGENTNLAQPLTVNEKNIKEISLRIEFVCVCLCLTVSTVPIVNIEDPVKAEINAKL